MYHHTNSNIEELDSCDDLQATRRSGRPQREIPLAFTNTLWGQEYTSNPNWERENLQAGNSSGANFLVGSRFRSPPQDPETGTIQILLCDSTITDAGPESRLATSTPFSHNQDEDINKPIHLPDGSVTPPPRLHSHRHTTQLPDFEEVLTYLNLDLPTVPASDEKSLALARSKTDKGYSAMKSWTQFRRAVVSDDGLESEHHNPSPLISPQPRKRCEWSDILTRWDDYEQWQLRTPAGRLS